MMKLLMPLAAPAPGDGGQQGAAGTLIIGNKSEDRVGFADPGGGRLPAGWPGEGLAIAPHPAKAAPR